MLLGHGDRRAGEPLLHAPAAHDARRRAARRRARRLARELARVDRPRHLRVHARPGRRARPPGARRGGARGDGPRRCRRSSTARARRLDDGRTAGLLPRVRHVVSNAVSLHVDLVPASKRRLQVLVPRSSRRCRGWTRSGRSARRGLRTSAFARTAELVRRECDNPVCAVANFTYGPGPDVLWRHENLTPRRTSGSAASSAGCRRGSSRRWRKCAAAGHLVAVDDTVDGLPDDFAAAPPRTRARFTLLAGAENRCFLPSGQRRTHAWFEARRPGASRAARPAGLLAHGRVLRARRGAGRVPADRRGAGALATTRKFPSNTATSGFSAVTVGGGKTVEASALRAPSAPGRILEPARCCGCAPTTSSSRCSARATTRPSRSSSRATTRLLAYTRRMLGGSRTDAEDAIQDVFFSAYCALRHDERPITLRAWLYRIAHNRCIDQIRRPSPAPADVLDVSRAPLRDPVAEAERRENVRRLVDDMRRLPEQQRSALLMRGLEGIATPRSPPPSASASRRSSRCWSAPASASPRRDEARNGRAPTSARARGRATTAASADPAARGSTCATAPAAASTGSACATCSARSTALAPRARRARHDRQAPRHRRRRVGRRASAPAGGGRRRREDTAPGGAEAAGLVARPRSRPRRGRGPHVAAPPMRPGPRRPPPTTAQTAAVLAQVDRRGRPPRPRAAPSGRIQRSRPTRPAPDARSATARGRALA